jgi:hypothetical protein
MKWRTPDPEIYLKVQDEASPRARQLALKLKAVSKNEADMVARILKMFREGEFQYSLSVPQMSSLDQFLFSYKMGFCEHYAAATATLLRWGGIPSRVVVGYQGGTNSFLMDYILVRQLDAHAWVEYWDSARKFWQRVDPTEVVAPARLAMGAESFNDKYLQGSVEDLLAGVDLRRWFGDGLRSKLFRLRLVFDQAEAAWSSFLLKYDFTYQQELLSWLGWKGVKRWHLFALSFTCFIMVAFWASWRLARRARKKDWGQKLYERLCRKLTKKGLARGFAEGPLSYRNRALGAFPHHHQELAELFDEVLSFRFGPPDAKPRKARYRRLRRRMDRELLTGRSP